MKKLLVDQKEKALKITEDKVNALDFWSGVKVPDGANASFEPFPIDTKVYHFHPNAFIEQMRRTQPNCFCNKDITVEAFEEIFRKGPWFTGKVRNPSSDDPNPTDMSKYPNVYKISTEKLVYALNKTMNKFEINTCIQKAHFLGQVGAETGFQSTREFASGWYYDIRDFQSKHNLYQQYLNYLKKYGGSGTIEQQLDRIKIDYESCKEDYDIYQKNIKIKGFDLKPYKMKHDKYVPFLADKNLYESYKVHLGAYNSYNKRIKAKHTTIGDGPKYKGHGLLQLTWKINFEKFKTRLKLGCDSNPELLSSDIKNACDMAGSWWRKPLTGWGDINPKSENDDLLMATLAINGGMKGLTHRYKYTQNALTFLGVKDCDKYNRLNIGEYSFESSEIEKSKYCYKYDKNGNPVGLKSSTVNLVKDALKKAKDDYEK